MPLRGESVGTAYIKVFADGSSIPRDIEDEFDEVDRIADRHGTKFAKNFKEKFHEELAAHDKNSLDNAFAQALADDKAINKFFSGSDWERIKTRFNQEFGTLGDEEIRSMEDSFRRKGSLSGIEESIESVVRRINIQFDKLRATADAEAETEAKRIRKLGEDWRAVWNGVEDDTDRAGNSLTRFFRRLRSGQRDTDKAVTVFGRLGRTVDHLADGIGRAFGKGSRNDFLNFTGSFIANASKLVSLPFKILDNIGQFAQGFRLALSEGEGFFSAMKSGFTAMAADAEGAGTSLSGAFSSVLIALPALLIALVAIIGVLSIVASLISGIVAALIAMASTISFAAVGAIAALAAAFPPLILGIGVAILAFKTMTSAQQKALKEGLKPFLDSLKELGGVARAGFIDGMGHAFDRLTGSLDSLKPLVHDIGESLGDILRRVINLKDKPGPTHLVATLERLAPDMLRRIGGIILNLTRALSNLFADATPLADVFLGWLRRITREFRIWVHDHPVEIEHFLKRAADSAKTFGHFLGAASKVLGDLLFSKSGQKQGNNIFGELADQLDTFDKFLDSHPDGVRDFFKNGHQVARDIGQVALSIVDIFDALESPEGQRNLHSLLDALTKIAALAGPLSFVSNLSFSGLTTLATISPAIGSGFGKVIEFFQEINNFKLDPGFAHGLVSWIPGALTKIGHFFRTLGGLFSGEGGGKVLAIRPPTINWGSALQKVATFFGDVSRLGTAPTREIATRFAGMAADVAHFINSIPGRLGGLGERFAVAAAGWTLRILNQFSRLPDQIVGFFAGLGQRIINAIGSIHIPVHIDIPSGFGKFLGPAGLLLPHTASGGIFDSEQVRVIAEAGREAVVPLTGPLSQVDPSVRELSAIARGLASPNVSTLQTVPGKTINVEQNITTPATDPVAAASEFLNHLTAVVA